MSKQARMVDAVVQWLHQNGSPVTEQYLVRCTLCPIQQWDEEAFAGAVIIRVNVTGQHSTSRLMEKKGGINIG